MYTEELELDAALDDCIAKANLTIGLESVFPDLPENSKLGRKVLEVASMHTGITPTYSAEGIGDFLINVWEGIKNVMSKIWESIKKFAKWVKESIGNMFGKIDDKRIDSIADSDVVVEVEEAAELPDLAKLKKMNEDVLYEGDVEKQIDALEKVDEDLTDDVAEVIEAGTAEVDKGKVKDLNEFFTNNQVVIESTIDPHSGKETRNAVTVVPLNRKTNTVKIKRMSGKDLAKMAKDTKSLQKDVEDAVENLTDTKWGEKRLADLDKIIKRISKAGTLKAKSVVKKQAITLSGVVRDNLKVKRAMARDLLESLEARIKIIDGAIKAMEAAEKADKE